MRSALLALLLVAASAPAQTVVDWNAALEIDERAIAEMMARLAADSSPQFAAAVAQKAEALAALGHADDARMYRKLARRLGANVPADAAPAVLPTLLERPPLRVGHDVTAPVVLKRVNPRYAEGARKARLSGIVIVETIIDKNGVIRDADVLKGIAPTLDYAAVDAVRQWRFLPTRLNGEAVPVIFNLTINFRLVADEDETMPRY